MCMHQLTLHPNLKHASERVERPGGSHEGFGRKKKARRSRVWSDHGRIVSGSWSDRFRNVNGVYLFFVRVRSTDFF